MKYSEESFSSVRRRRILFNVLGSLVGFLAVAILLNCLGMRHFVRWHLDPRDVSVLSPMTKEALKDLKQDVKIVVLFKENLPVYAAINSLLREYENASAYIKVERVDYTKDPTLAESIKSKYRLNLPSMENETLFRDLVIFETEGKPPRVIYENEFSDFNVADVTSGKEQKIKRTSFKGEMLFTAAIASLMEDGERVAYFSMGHNEYDPENKDEYNGYSKFAEILTQNYIKVKKLHIWSEEKVPADCSLLIVAGPRKPLVDQEIVKVGEYLKRGGSLMVMLPQEGVTRLDTLLKDWGVEVKDELVYDPASTLNDNLVVTNFNSQSPITRPLFGSLIYLPSSHAVMKSEYAGKAADAPQVLELFRSSQLGHLGGATAKEDTAKTEAKTEGKEYSMAVSVEKGALQGLDSITGTTRIVAVGGSVFLNNRWIDASYGNRDFAVLAVNWLLDRTQLMKGVGPRAIVEYQLNLSKTQVNLLMWIMLAIVPGIVMGLGLIVWIQRRN